MANEGYGFEGEVLDNSFSIFEICIKAGRFGQRAATMAGEVEADEVVVLEEATRGW